MFTEQQLDFIKNCAKQRKNQGEVSVYILARDLAADGFLWEGWTEQQLNIIKYCAEECKRQHSGEMSVYDMVNAWDMALERTLNEPEEARQVDLDFIEWLGQLVEPIDNKSGFRTIPIGISDGFDWIEKAQWQDVPRLLEYLLASYYAGYLTPVKDEYSNSHPLAVTAEDQFYYEFENIHPFRDGNGRTGKILYNYLLGTLDNPVMPPNFWGSSNP